MGRSNLASYRQNKTSGLSRVIPGKQGWFPFWKWFHARSCVNRPMLGWRQVHRSKRTTHMLPLTEGAKAQWKRTVFNNGLWISIRCSCGLSVPTSSTALDTSCIIGQALFPHLSLHLSTWAQTRLFNQKELKIALSTNLTLEGTIGEISEDDWGGDTGDHRLLRVLSSWSMQEKVA